jgi:hypothetical protein
MAKLCEDCRWASSLEDVRFSECNAPQNIIDKIAETDLVLERLDMARPAAKVRRWTYCKTHRDAGWFGARWLNVCGKAGRWWEPKPCDMPGVDAMTPPGASQPPSV